FDAGGGHSFSLVKVATTTMTFGEFADAAQLLGSKGTYRVSSAAAAKLFALVLEEKLGGLSITFDPVAIKTDAPHTRENSSSDGFDLQQFNDPDTGTAAAIAHLDAIDRLTEESVNVAVVDSGFARPSDFGVGLAASEPLDYGKAFADIPHADCT